MCIIIVGMKHLSDADIEQMVAENFTPDFRAVNRDVRRNLQLGRRIPAAPDVVPRHIVLDLHNHTVEQAWDSIMRIATSGARTATIITGASGILHQKFPQWATESILAPYIFAFAPINNGSFHVQFVKQSRRE